jgi:hypothetical protein
VYIESDPRLLTPNSEGFLTLRAPLALRQERSTSVLAISATEGDRAHAFVRVGACPSRRQHDHAVNREGSDRPAHDLTPLDSTLTENSPAYPNSRPAKPLESIANLLSPLELTLTRKALNCPNLQQITPLESITNLLSPLDSTLTKNAPVSPLESALTKYNDLKSHRITLLQKRWGRGVNCAATSSARETAWELPGESRRWLPAPGSAGGAARARAPSILSAG